MLDDDDIKVTFYIQKKALLLGVLTPHMTWDDPSGEERREIIENAERKVKAKPNPDLNWLVWRNELRN